MAASIAAILSAAAALPATAQTVTGQVTVNGFVAARCWASLEGDTTFSGIISLGELTQTNGTLSSSLTASNAASPAGMVAFLVGCSGSGSTVTLSATRLSNPVEPALPTWSNDIDYTAQINIAMAAGGFQTVNYTTAATPPAATVSAISGVYANANNNFEVKVFGLTAENGASSFLVPGSYQGIISISVAPTS